MTCSYCNGTGLLPFVNNHGETIPYAFVDCECKTESIPAYVKLTPEDIDFPVSRDFYRYYASRNHWTDPGPMQQPFEAPKSELVKLQKIIGIPVRQPGSKRKSAF
jgi:hypothetical protein